MRKPANPNAALKFQQNQLKSRTQITIMTKSLKCTRTLWTETAKYLQNNRLDKELFLLVGVKSLRFKVMKKRNKRIEIIKLLTS